MALLHPARDRSDDHRSKFWLVPDDLFAVREVHADSFNDRDEGRHQLVATGGQHHLSISEGSMSEVAVISTFGSDDECARGILALHDARIHEFRAFFPFPSEKIMEAVDHVRSWGRSPVRYWQLFGGLSGLTGFFVHNRMPVFEGYPGYRSRFTEDKFGVVVQCDESAAARVESV